MLYINTCVWNLGASLVAQTVKNPPTMQDTRVQSLGWEDPLEKAMAPHSSILAWRIPWTEGPWTTVHGVAQSQTRLRDFTFTRHFHALEQEMATHSCSCLENPRDGGAWWAAVYGVAQSRKRLK